MAQDPSNTVTDCSDTWTTYEYSNAKLKPEYSRQFSLGAVMEPSRHLNVSLDYWSIQKSNLISTLGADVILANLDKYGSLVHRDEDNWIDHIDLVKENRGKQRISGLDLEFNLKGLDTGVGTFGLRLNGTWTLSSKQQTGDGDPTSATSATSSTTAWCSAGGTRCRWTGNRAPTAPRCPTVTCRATRTRPSSASRTAGWAPTRCGT
jgi:outer membrane receptor protein involved in Fe transport